MVINNLARVAAVCGAVWTGPLFCENVTDPATLAEIDGAIRTRIEGWYQEQRIDLCRGLGSGQIYDIEDEEVRLQGKTATVQYVLVQFESCEECISSDLA